MTSLSKIEFEIIEGIFHDGLGTFAELMLANKLIESARLDQPQFNLSNSEAKMRDAVRETSRRNQFSDITTRLVI